MSNNTQFYVDSHCTGQRKNLKNWLELTDSLWK